MSTNQPQTARAADLQLVADLARAAGLAKQEPRDGAYQDAAPFVILRDADGGEFVEFLKERMAAPGRRDGIVPLLDPASFVAYVKLHHNGTPIYGNPNPASFIAVLNEHIGGGEHAKGAGIAGHRDHRATLTLSHSDEWSAWMSHNGQAKAFESTEDFASFLEANSFDIEEPPAATFMEIALNFHVNESAVYSKSQRLSDGQVLLTYNRAVEGSTATAEGGHMKMPTKFKIRVPVFRGAGQPFYTCEAHFRYRLTGNGRIRIWYDLIRPAKVVEQAFRDVWASIGAQLEVPVLYGKPE